MASWKGFRLIELDFEWTRDDQMALIHDWDYSVKRLFREESRVYSSKEFRNFKEIACLH